MILSRMEYTMCIITCDQEETYIYQNPITSEKWLATKTNCYICYGRLLDILLSSYPVMIAH